jgi:glycosyltransferase involved in cell wall biosynthesis
LKAIAITEPADWYIAHTQATLAIAAMAAVRWKAKLGFDCEDLLAEMGTDPRDIVSLLQRHYLPLCNYVSVPSECLGARLAETYTLPNLLVLYNVFPLNFAEALLSPNQRATNSALRLHWFGQTIGPGRGLEEAIESLGLIAHENFELHLRGRLTTAFRSKVEALSERNHIVNKVFFHEPVSPQNLINTMDQFDVGLALERQHHGNYSLAATNKLLSYVLAGLAVAATDTPGHREVMNQMPSAGFLYDAANPRDLAEGLRQWIENRAALLAAQNAAWKAARLKFCWDMEKEKLLSALQPAHQYAASAVH